MPERNRISTKIAEARKTRGLTQEQLADEAGVTVRTIQRLESGENTPRAFTLKAIAGALGLDFTGLVAKQEESKSTSISPTETVEPTSPGLPVTSVDPTPDHHESEAYFLRLLTLSCFSFIVVPYVHFLIPMQMLSKRKDLTRVTNRFAKKTILLQVYWVVALNASLLLTLVANFLLARKAPGHHISYLLITGIMYAVNAAILLGTFSRLPVSSQDALPARAPQQRDNRFVG